MEWQDPLGLPRLALLLGSCSWESSHTFTIPHPHPGLEDWCCRQLLFTPRILNLQNKSKKIGKGSNCGSSCNFTARHCLFQPFSQIFLHGSCQGFMHWFCQGCSSHCLEWAINPEGDPQLPPPSAPGTPVPSGMAFLGSGALAQGRDKRGHSVRLQALTHRPFLCPAQKKEDKAGMRDKERKARQEKNTGEGYGCKTHFGTSFPHKLQAQRSGVSGEANPFFLPKPRTPRCWHCPCCHLGVPGEGCQSFGGALKRAQRNKSFETLPAWWPVSACESSWRSRLIRLCIFEAFSVSQTNDQLQLIFNPLKGFRYSPL